MVHARPSFTGKGPQGKRIWLSAGSMFERDFFDPLGPLITGNVSPIGAHVTAETGVRFSKDIAVRKGNAKL